TGSAPRSWRAGGASRWTCQRTSPAWRRCWPCARRASRVGRGRARPVPFALALLLFLRSGPGALVVETTWLRWLRDLLGATAPAASATLVAFFLGQALGAPGAARLAPRAARPP